MTTAQTALEWSPLWEAMKADKSAWIPTTESMYWEMLECLPPRAMRNGAFLVGEADQARCRRPWQASPVPKASRGGSRCATGFEILTMATARTAE